MSNIPSVKKELEKLHQLVATADNTKVPFLKALFNYMGFVEKEKILHKITTIMKEDSAKESIQMIQESMHNKNMQDYYQHQADEDLGNHYPVFEYNQLTDFSRDFQEVQNIETEEEMIKTPIVTKTDTPSGVRTSHTSGSAFLTLAKHNVFTKQIEPLHAFLIKQLDWIQAHGVFSKYLDYNDKDGVLYFQEKEIKMNIKKVPTNAHHLLSYLLKNNPFEKHYCDDLDSDRVLFESEKHWKSYYDACVDIQTKVEKATGIADFLDFSSGKGMYICLNSKYSLNESL